VRSAIIEDTKHKIPSAMILAGMSSYLYKLTLGNNIAGHARLFTQIKEELNNVIDGPVIVVSAADVINLTALLRKIVSECLQIELTEEEGYEQEPSKV
jgi:Origin recognition complex (ORC) subunit 3 N-terminus